MPLPNDSRAAGHSDDALAGHFEALGLNGYEARVLVALVRLGCATAQRVAQVSGITRTNVYRVLDELNLRGLVTPLPGKVTQWAVGEPDDMLAQLHSAQEQRFRELEARMADAKELMAELAPRDAGLVPPHMRLLRSSSAAMRAYGELLAETQSELLMFARSPFINPEHLNPAVVAAARRGVSMRVLYQAHDLDGPETGPYRKVLETYHAAGVVGRVVEALPVKLTVFDQAKALVALPESPIPDSSYPTMTLVVHTGYATLLARAFENYWADSRPYEPCHQMRAAQRPRHGTAGPVDAPPLSVHRPEDGRCSQ